MINREFESRRNAKKQGAPKGTGRIAEEIEAKVIALHKAHTEWGKERINQEMTKANNWVALVSRNTVRRILEDAEMWNSGKRLIKKSWLKPVVRTADAPGQTLNVDLLFVPSCHLADMKLPAVSGSSGHLVIGSRAREAISWQGVRKYRS